MIPERVLDLLEDLADKLGIELRYSILDSDGGLCKVKGRMVLMVDLNLPISEKIRVIARCLPRDGLENMYIPPAIRATIERENEDS